MRRRASYVYIKEHATAMTAVKMNGQPMHAYDVTVEWLRQVQYQIQPTSRPPGRIGSPSGTCFMATEFMQ